MYRDYFENFNTTRKVRPQLVVMFLMIFATILLVTQVSQAALIITDNQIAQLRSQLNSDVETDPSLSTNESLRRYLQASNGRVNLAAHKLERTADWRILNKIDELDDWTGSPSLNESLPYAITGYSKEGNPVFYVPLGHWDFRSIRREILSKELIMYVNQLLEKALRATETAVNPKTGEKVNQTIFIIDLDGFSIRSLLTDYSSAFLTLTRLRLLHDVHYPLLGSKWYVIRTPSSLAALWRVYKWTVSRRTRSSVEVYSRFSRRWKQVLLDKIPKESLPVALGGSAVVKF